MAKDEDKKEETEKDESQDESGNGSGSHDESDEGEEKSSPAAEDADADADEQEGDGADDSSDEEEEPKVAAKPKAQSTPAPRAAALRPAAAAAHGGAHAHDDHGFGHLVSLQLLGAVLGTLLVLTYITYAVTKVDLGGQWNLVVAMVIATIKAGLVITFFMHMLWDKKFNLLVFLSSVLFLILFLSFALTDRKEYQHLIDQREAAQQAQK